MNRKLAALSKPEIELPAAHDWRTTDTDEINKRRRRAQIEPLRVTEMGGDHPIFATFRVSSGSGMTYCVEIRSLRERLCFCTCVDFRINGLGTCKHVEASLHYLEVRHGRRFDEALHSESPVIDIVPDPAGDTLRIERAMSHLPDRLRRRFASHGRLRGKEPEQALEEIRKARIPYLRISQQVAPWLQARQQIEERKVLLREYEQKVQSGEWPAQETLAPLYPYQREGMLHLAFKERALLADEMGLGKTIQAIAACALLQRLGKASRVPGRCSRLAKDRVGRTDSTLHAPPLSPCVWLAQEETCALRVTRLFHCHQLRTGGARRPRHQSNPQARSGYPG